MNTRVTVLCGVLAALAVALTWLFQIPMLGGYIHPGDSVIYIAAYLLGGVPAMAVGALSGLIVDLLSGYAVYALPTLIIKALMGAATAWLFKRLNQKTSGRIAAMALGGTVMVAGYFIAEIILFDYARAAVNMPPNLLQLAAGVLIALPVISLLKKKSYFNQVNAD